MCSPNARWDGKQDFVLFGLISSMLILSYNDSKQPTLNFNTQIFSRKCLHYKKVKKKRLAILNARQFGNDLDRYIQPEIIKVTKFHN